MTYRELLQQALEVLDKISMGGSPEWADDVIPAIRTRLAQPDPDAVAWINPVTLQYLKDKKEGVHLVYEDEMVNSIPLFEYQPEKEWVGLTYEDIIKIWNKTYRNDNVLPTTFAMAIEAHLKEKNHG